MRTKDLKDIRDLRDLDKNDVLELIDELRAIAAKRGIELLAQGRTEARRALGGPDERALALAFVAGIGIGLAIGAAAAALMTPLPGTEARRKLAWQMDRARDRMPLRTDGDGRSVYERGESEGATEADLGTIS